MSVEQGQKKRVLIVEDSQEITELVGTRLRASGYEVSVATDGLNGLAKAREEKPDLIILDVMLPRLRGHEVCLILKRDVAYAQIKVVMLTAKTDDLNERWGVEAGTDAYIRKPFEASALLETVQSLLTASSPNGGGEP